MQMYEEKKELADYLTLITSVGYLDGSPDFSPEFRYLFDKVELSLKSNLLLGLYKEGLTAFNQYIFPFAANFATALAPPKFITSNGTVDELVLQIISKINLIEDALTLQRSTVQEIDQHIFKGSFSGELETSVPFYSWPAEKKNSRDGGLAIWECRHFIGSR